MRRLTLHEEGLRSQAPTDYPCFNMDGYIRFTPGCRMRCCIVPAKTPDDQYSPKWSALLQARMQDEEAVAQPNFGSAKRSSKRAKTPSSYASSSFSPSDDPAAAEFFGRRQVRKMYGQDPDKFTPAGGKTRRHRQE